MARYHVEPLTVEQLVARARVYDNLATAAQTDYIRDLGGDVPDGLTKAAASALIDSLKSIRAARAAARSYGIGGGASEIWD